MRKDRSLLIVSEENLITRVIKSLKKFLKLRQENDEITNRTAEVITSEKIEIKVKRSLKLDELEKLENKILEDISYIDNLTEDELDSLGEYYDMRITELKEILNNKKSDYFKLISSKKV